MVFNLFENIEQVIKKYPLKIQQKEFLPALEKQLLSAFIEDIHLLLAMKSIEENKNFFKSSLTYFINVPEQIFGILDFIFAECEKQL